MKYEVEFGHFFCWRLLRPAYISYFSEKLLMKLKSPNLLNHRDLEQSRSLCLNPLSTTILSECQYFLKE